MNLRMSKNALRFRLSKEESLILYTNGILSEKVNFGTNTLDFSLKSSKKPIIEAQFKNNSVLISIPETTIENWAKSDQIKIVSKISLVNDEYLSISIEKDLFDEKKRKRKG